jgi:uncharacterized delta-60 repeat protein/prepilin-type N-terminal cleavage/methylation domain-containing protein
MADTAPVRSRRGFTLIELLVVVLVLGVLAAIAIPRFTGARNRAQDAVARADLRSAYTAALTARAAGGAWPDATTLTATEAAPRTTSGAASVGTVSVANPAGTFRAAAVSASGTCFRLSADANGTPTWAQDSDVCTALPPLGIAYADQSFTAGVADTLTPAVTGGLGSGRTFSVTAGSLPAGVTLDPATGALSTTGLTGSSNGALDAGFANGLTGASSSVRTIAVQADGKVLIGGEFTTVHGVARGRIARLNTDGTLDTTFANGLALADDAVYGIAVQPDGRIVIAGWFTTVNGVARGRIARLNTDGTLDTTFANGLAGAGHLVYSLALQSDGKVIVGGSFNSVNGTTRNRIARLNSDGTVDAGFANGTSGPNNFVRAIAPLPDGKVLIGGNFLGVDGASRSRIARLNANGTVDTTFGNGMTLSDNAVQAIVPLSDGKVLVGGYFTTFNGVSRPYIVRIQADGTVDTTFTNGQTGPGSVVEAIALQPDGKMVIGGWFTNVSGSARNRVARLNADGTHDTTFANGSTLADTWVLSVALQPDGKVLIGGDFTIVNGTTVNRITRLGGVSIPGFPAAVTVQVAESGGGTASANLTLTVA